MSFEPSCPASLFFTQSLNIIFSHFCKHRWGFIAVWFDYKATHVLSAKLSLVYEISIMGLQLYCRGHTAERGRREREWEENNNNNNNTKCSQDWLEFAVFYLLRHAAFQHPDLQHWCDIELHLFNNTDWVRWRSKVCHMHWLSQVWFATLCQEKL